MILTRSYPRTRQYDQMIEPIEFIKVGTVDEIRESGWIKVHLLGFEIAILSDNKEFLAVELSNLKSRMQKSFLPEDMQFSKSRVKKLIESFLSGPQGQSWGGLRYFPVRVEGNSVYVGVSMNRKES